MSGMGGRKAQSARQAFHERLTRDILDRAQRYRHRSNRFIAQDGGTRGNVHDIKRRIAENAEKRWLIGEAMKLEAGVEGHDLTGERDGGIAWTDRARILAPAGENRVQLATLAHECGHVFLHSAGTPGYWLPSHIKEMEAECYAHQAFAAYGMRMPKQITLWGRAYVNQWIEADRADGIAIDPRAVAYANGTMSPYTPLRDIPASWKRLGLGTNAASMLAGVGIRSTSLDPAAMIEMAERAARSQRRWRWWRRLGRDLAGEGKFLVEHLSVGWLFGFIALKVLKALDLLRDWALKTDFEMSLSEFAFTVVGTLTWVLIVMLWRTRPGAYSKRARLREREWRGY